MDADWLERLAAEVPRLSLSQGATVVGYLRTESGMGELSRSTIRALRDVANAKPSSEAEAHARDAAVTVLANAGDTSVSASLIKGLKSTDPAERWRAAHSLASLGDYSNAASALADDDANLRSDLACSILAREARR